MKSKTVTVEADGVCTVKGKSALKLQEAEPVKGKKSQGPSPAAGESQGVAGADKKARKPPQKGAQTGSATLEIHVADLNQKPQEGVAFKITMPDGVTVLGKLDKEGRGLAKGSSPGRFSRPRLVPFRAQRVVVFAVRVPFARLIANFLCNQARCYEQSGQDALSASRFREFLRKAPGLPAEEVEAVNRRIDELQRQTAGRAAPAPTVINLVSPAAPPAPVQAPTAAAGVDRSAELVSSPRPAPVNDSPVYARWWFWTGIGAVVVGGVVTAVLLGSHSGQKSPSCDQGVPCVH